MPSVNLFREPPRKSLQLSMVLASGDGKELAPTSVGPRSMIAGVSERSHSLINLTEQMDTAISAKIILPRILTLLDFYQEGVKFQLNNFLNL